MNQEKCLIGYTGFVGTTLMQQTNFNHLYNSKNINEIKGKTFDLVICAGAPAVKWKANQEPEQDLININLLINNLKEINTKYFILISTVDVYHSPILVDEDTVVDPMKADSYGRHRYYLEQFVKDRFNEHLIVRLPGLFGQGLKKNFIYDLIHDNCLHLTHWESEFQFYDMSNLWNDLLRCKENSFSLVNFAPEPLQVKEIAVKSLNIDFKYETPRGSIYYDMRSKHSHLFNAGSNYMYNKDEVLSQITDFINDEVRAKN